MCLAVPAAGEALARRTLRLLVLNRNFPPNSWQVSLEKLKSFAAREGRHVVPIAVLPFSRGTARNAFGLEELAVCLNGVQNRTDHGTNLDVTCNETCKVTSLFYNLYNTRFSTLCPAPCVLRHVGGA